MADRPSPRAAPRGLRPPRWHLVGVLVVAGLAGCDVPTGLPLIDTRWVLPTERSTFGVEDLLPAEVSLTPDSSAFVVNFDAVSFSTSLGALCPACVPLNGLTAPKPLFLGRFSSGIAFPAEVHAVAVLSGAVAIEIENQLNFDPLRPSASAPFGSMTVTITDDADDQVLGTLTVLGDTIPLPPGTTLQTQLVLDTATVSGSIIATVELFSPLGDPVAIDTSDLVRATAAPSNVLVSSVTIDVAGRTISIDPRDLDVEDIDEEIEKRIVEGGLIVDVANPFGVGAALQLTISGGSSGPIHKSVLVSPAPSSVIQVDFTVEELRSFLGEANVTLTGSGTVDPGAGPIVVLPGDELVLLGSFDLTLRLGEES